MGRKSDATVLSMKRTLGIWCLLGLLYGCSGAGYLPYAPHALNPSAINSLVSGASQGSGVPPGLLRAVLMAESSGDPSAISDAGAQGLMQLMPGTSAGCGIANPFEPMQNVECGAGYLRSLLRRYHQNVTLAVAAYNAGPGAIVGHAVPQNGQTEIYVDRVMQALAVERRGRCVSSRADQLHPRHR